MVKKQILDILLKLSGKSFKNEYIRFKNLNSIDKLINYQEESLKNLLIHAYKNVTYYTQIFDEIGLVKNTNIVDLSKFNKIPILTKDKIRKNYQTLISKDYEKRGWYNYSSGGSTGEPLKIIKDLLYNKRARATAKFYQNMIGISNNNPKNINLWGSDRDIREGAWDIKERVQNWFGNTKLLNSFKMKEEDMDKYCKVINSFKPEFIIGYAGCLYELCRYAENKNIQLFTPKVIISSAETLRDDMRQKIEIMFGTKLFNFYGSREVGALAGECKYGSMHIFSFSNFIEILDKNNQLVDNNEEGRVIVTNLHNYSMPFIRYEIGDMAITGSKSCKCGSSLPVLKQITGRITDHFKLENGTMVPAEFIIHLIGVVCNKGQINKFQVIQEEYKKIRIFIVPQGKINKSEMEEIENKMKTVMGKDIKFIWEFVKDIPKTDSGKYVYTKSLV
jgi:phenylacetate-CoA ligase